MGCVPRLRHRAGAALRIVSDMGWVASKVRRKFWSLKYVAVGVFLLVSSCFIVLQVKDYALLANVEEEFDCSPLPIQPLVLDPGRALVRSITEARRVASSNGSDPSTLELTPEELNVWNRLHPCHSRGPDGLLSFYNRRNYSAGSEVLANPLWDEVFQEYSKLHRECMKQVGDVSNYFLQTNVTTGCKFLVADIEDNTAFGDKILMLVSSLLYAIISQRVILIPATTFVPSYMCEPFAGSSWLLNPSSFSFPRTSHTHLWKMDKEIFKSIDLHLKRCSFPLTSPSVPRGPYAAGFRITQRHFRQRFYCTLEQAVYSEATFMYFSGFGYTIPQLFAAPVFRPVLEALFPDKIVITRVLRSAYLPANPVWRLIRGLDEGYLQPADRRVGIQLQFNGKSSPRYEEMNDIINKRIADCLIQNDIFPNVSDSWPSRKLPNPPTTRVIRVFIASLFLGLKDHLSPRFERDPISTGEGIGLVQVSRDGYEEFSVEQDTEDFKEALLLSFSDQLLVTPTSTLGSVAHGYGALIPWFIEVRKDTQTDSYGFCERGQTVEACSQFAEKKYACSRNSSADGEALADVVPYIENCLTVDHDAGIQLITRPGI